MTVTIKELEAFADGWNLEVYARSRARSAPSDVA
jgi:hypothetical protein